jgi:hypothetical protein
MKTIFKLSGCLLASLLFLSSCSRNHLSDSELIQEKYAKFSAELEQNNQQKPLNSGPANAEPEAKINRVGTSGSTVQNPVQKISGNQTLPAKPFAAMKQIKKIAKQQKLQPQQISNDQSNTKRGLSERMKLGLLIAGIGLIMMLVLGIIGPFFWVGSIVFAVGLVIILIELMDMQL